MLLKFCEKKIWNNFIVIKCMVFEMKNSEDKWVFYIADIADFLNCIISLTSLICKMGKNI